MTLEERLKAFDEIMGEDFPEGIKADLLIRGFFTAPASTKYHGNYEGGLFDHCLAVTRHLLDITEHHGLHWTVSRSPMLVGMFHDLCKMDQYVKSDGDNPYEYRKDTLLKGHGEKSIMLLSKYFTLTEEEILCIRYHMGAFTEKEEWSDYTRAVNKYATVLWTHTADMLASHVEGV